MDTKELKKLLDESECNDNFKALVLSMEGSRTDFQKKRQLPFWNGIMARLGEVYPSDTMTLSKILRQQPSSALPPRRKQTNPNGIKYVAVDVSPDGGYDDNDCPLCGKDGYDSKGKAITGNEIYDDVDDNQLAADEDNAKKERQESSLSNCGSVDAVMNYFGPDVDSAKEQMKEILSANEIKVHHALGYEKLANEVLLFLQSQKK